MKGRLVRNIVSVMGEKVVRKLANLSEGRHLMPHIIVMFTKLVMGVALTVVKGQTEWEVVEGEKLIHWVRERLK